MIWNHRLDHRGSGLKGTDDEEQQRSAEEGQGLHTRNPIRFPPKFKTSPRHTMGATAIWGATTDGG